MASVARCTLVTTSSVAVKRFVDIVGGVLEPRGVGNEGV